MDAWLEQYKMMFTALYTHGKEAELRIYRGEGHAPSGPANIRDMWNRVFLWFDRYLKIRRDALGHLSLRDDESSTLGVDHQVRLLKNYVGYRLGAEWQRSLVFVLSPALDSRSLYGAGPTPGRSV